MENGDDKQEGRRDKGLIQKREQGEKERCQ